MVVNTGVTSMFLQKHKWFQQRHQLIANVVFHFKHKGIVDE